MNKADFEESLQGIEDAVAFATGSRIEGPRISRRVGEYLFSAFYSEEDRCFVGTCTKYPSVSAIGEDFEEALVEIVNLVYSLEEE